jgi:hypothetical protein
MDTLRLALADPVGDPDIVAGMNLDGRVSDGTDPVGCLHPDFASPPPDREPGVDNQLGPILSAIPFLDTEFARAIATGQWLVLIAVNDAPSARVIRLFRGHTMDGGPPRLSGGRIASDQTFFITQPLGELIADPADARTRTEPGRLSFPMHPLVSAPINFTSARLYGDFTREGVGQGVLGGAYPVGEAVDSLVEVDPDAIPHALARSVLDSMADSDVVVPSGECTAVSAAFTFTAVPATIELEP